MRCFPSWMMRSLRGWRRSANRGVPGRAKFSSTRETRNTGFLSCLEGSIEIIGIANGEETVLAVHGRGVFTGEINQLPGGAVWFDAGRAKQAHTRNQQGECGA